MRRIGMAMLLAIQLGACWGVPDNYPTLTLDEKIAAYERHLKWKGAVNSDNAQSWIAWHGHEAAQRMVPYLRQEKRQLPLHEAIQIVWDVSSRGCDLRGSEAESALRELLRTKRQVMDNVELIAAEAAVGSIERNDPLEPRLLYGGPEGPCERAYRAKEGETKREGATEPGSNL